MSQLYALTPDSATLQLKKFQLFLPEKLRFSQTANTKDKKCPTYSTIITAETGKPGQKQKRKQEKKE
jgi:hypothetical protein